MTRVVTFGEIMGRLTPEGFLRFQQCLPGVLRVSFAGAEANVAVAIACVGGEVSFVTALPKHPIADACVANLRSLGVDTRYILRTEEGRLGLYFLETGANQRPGNVIYDRAGSAISQTAFKQYPWQEIFDGSDWLHITGITPSLSRIAAEVTLSAVKEAKARLLQVSCDLNFRKKLWRWDAGCSANQLAERTMREILPYVDLVVANEEDAADVLRIRARATDVQAGEIAVEHYPEVAREIVRQFPNVSRIAITLRESISATHNNWGAMVFDSNRNTAFFAPLKNGNYEPYQIRSIVDRVGAGDSFAGALIFALRTPELSPIETAVAFAAAASCLAHSISGDYNYISRNEVESLMRGSGSGRVIR
ncbi:MAG TPA: sugar kinase [Acidobacteriota bacterium]|nr:sugar kinase [Acidobacteriota bacterium]